MLSIWHWHTHTCAHTKRKKWNEEIRKWLIIRNDNHRETKTYNSVSLPLLRTLQFFLSLSFSKIIFRPSPPSSLYMLQLIPVLATRNCNWNWNYVNEWNIITGRWLCHRHHHRRAQFPEYIRDQIIVWFNGFECSSCVLACPRQLDEAIRRSLCSVEILAGSEIAFSSHFGFQMEVWHCECKSVADWWQLNQYVSVCRDRWVRVALCLFVLRWMWCIFSTTNVLSLTWIERVSDGQQLFRTIFNFICQSALTRQSTYARHRICVPNQCVKRIKSKRAYSTDYELR